MKINFIDIAIVWIGIVFLFFLNDNVSSLQCYNCSSETSYDCLYPIENVTSQADCGDIGECYINIANQITYRGCRDLSSPVEEPVRCSNQDLCNNWMYPRDRKMCYQCSDCYETIGHPKICILYEKSDECYINVDPITKITSRGCLSDLNATCTTEENCAKCSTKNGCNSQIGKVAMSCIVCSSESEDKCLAGDWIQDKACHVSDIIHARERNISFGLDRTCFTKIKEGRIIERGFSIDMNSKYDDAEKCASENCNDNCYGMCACDSKNEPNCRASLGTFPTALCAATNQCYTCEDYNLNIHRGCGLVTENWNCQYCNSSLCNTQKPLECFSCSSETEPNCSKFIKESSSDKKMVCRSLTDKCVTTNENGYTVRGCSSAFTPFSIHKCHIKDCKICDESLCNTHILPKDSLKCHQCYNSTHCNEPQEHNQIEPCSFYNHKEQCFLYADEYHQMIRGCTSNTQLFAQCQQYGPERCLIFPEDGGNFLGIYGNKEFSCFSCSLDDKNCPWAQDAITAKTCKHLYYEATACYTYEHNETAAIRGCYYDANVNECSRFDQKCHICPSNLCNMRNLLTQQCFQCDSTLENVTDCVGNIENLSSTSCLAENQTFDTKGCYTKKFGRQVVRGCSFDLPKTTFEDCLQFMDPNCLFCRKSDCNGQRLSGSNQLNLFSLNSFVLLQILSKLFY